MTGSAHLFTARKLAEEPEELQTKAGKLWIKLLIEVKTWRRGTDGEASQEEVTWIPVNLFSKVAETARTFLKIGDPVSLTCRVSGTEYKATDGKVRRGITLAAEHLHLIPNRRRASPDPTQATREVR